MRNVLAFLVCSSFTPLMGADLSGDLKLSEKLLQEIELIDRAVCNGGQLCSPVQNKLRGKRFDPSAQIKRTKRNLAHVIAVIAGKSTADFNDAKKCFEYVKEIKVSFLLRDTRMKLPYEYLPKGGLREYVLLETCREVDSDCSDEKYAVWEECVLKKDQAGALDIINKNNLLNLQRRLDFHHSVVLAPVDAAPAPDPSPIQTPVQKNPSLVVLSLRVPSEGSSGSRVRKHSRKRRELQSAQSSPVVEVSSIQETVKRLLTFAATDEWGSFKAVLEATFCNREQLCPGMAGLFHALESQDQAFFTVIVGAVRRKLIEIPSWNACNNEGDTLWHSAMRNGMSEVFGVLEEFGVVRDTKNRHGALPYSCSSIDFMRSCLARVRGESRGFFDAYKNSLLAATSHDWEKTVSACSGLSDDELKTFLKQLKGEDREWFLDQVAVTDTHDFCVRVMRLHKRDYMLKKDLEYRVLRKGSKAKVDALFVQGISASPDPYGEVPAACVLLRDDSLVGELQFLRFPEHVQSLRTRGANGNTPLMEAVGNKCVTDIGIKNMIKAYKEHGFDVGRLLSDRIASGKTLLEHIQNLRPSLVKFLENLQKKRAVSSGEETEVYETEVKSLVPRKKKPKDC